MSMGTASHICAAASGGPRYDGNMSPEQRRSVTNGIWMCRNHGTTIDSTDPKFTTEVLRTWKKEAEAESRLRVLNGSMPLGSVMGHTTADLFAAAAADIEVFRRTSRWPASSVELSVTIEGGNESTTTKSLATVVLSLDDLVLVAPPGMGKTTVLLQVAEGMIAAQVGVPIFVPLADWATDGKDLLTSILRRPSFRGISESSLRAAAAERGIVLLLDGWNELDNAARKRVRVQLSSLKAELPKLGLVISTRRQSLNVPIESLRVDLHPLSYSQQEAIALEMYGKPGVLIVDQAWRTAGIRDLVTIPLYLTVLLSLPTDSAFPTTKEELLRRFVKAHEAVPDHAEALHAALGGLHNRYLCDLAVRATNASAVALSEADARRSIVETGTKLISEAQVLALPRTDEVLDVLVSHHVLMRAGDTPGYSFQHQQFQEFYASHAVEAQMRLACGFPDKLMFLQAKMFDAPAWEEAILFAVERMSGTHESINACASSILAAMQVDPLLAAEMTYRSSDAVWALVSDEVQRFARAWHVPGTVDRALRFMLNSGRPDFLDLVWPLVTHEKDQTSLRALSNCRQLRPSIFGVGAISSIVALPKGPREVLVREIAWNADAKALDLATALAKVETEPDVLVSVVSALSFRRADHHITEILQAASDAMLDQIARHKSLQDEEVVDVQCRERLAQAQHRIAVMETDYDRLHHIARSPCNQIHEGVLFNLISTMEIHPQDREVGWITQELAAIYPAVVAKALVARLRNGRLLLYSSSDMVAAADVVLDDDPMLLLAQEDLGQFSLRASLAASVLGPRLAGTLFDQLFELGPKTKVNGQWDQEVNNLIHGLEQRLVLAPVESLLEAVKVRSAAATVPQMALMADILVRRRGQLSAKDRPFNDAVQKNIANLAEEWANRTLASGVARRGQMASLASLVACTPTDRLLPVLQALLDAELRLLRAFRAQANTEMWSPSDASNEARMRYGNHYARAFLTLKQPETKRVLYGYLGDPDFGDESATILVELWRTANEFPPTEGSLFGKFDFSDVPVRRTARSAVPDETCEEANAIFEVIVRLINNPNTELQTLAFVLGSTAVRLPHGKWHDVATQLLRLAPRGTRYKLLLNLCFSGETLPLCEVGRGIADTLDAAKTQAWILTQSDGYELRGWLQLLPFTDSPLTSLDMLTTLPNSFMNPHKLENLVSACGGLAGEVGASCLFKLAEIVPAFYGDAVWHRTIFQLAADSSATAHQLVGLAVHGVFEQQKPDRWAIVRDLAGLLEAHADVRSHTYALLVDGPTSQGLTLLAEVISVAPDVQGLLLLLRMEMETGQKFAGYRAVEHVATLRVPSGDLSGSVEILPAPVIRLRRDLLAMCTDGGPTDLAAQYLRAIDAVRDMHGQPEGEPRHPDFTSGVRWPLLNAQAPAQELY
jgi:hypothetical protein